MDITGFEAVVNVYNFELCHVKSATFVEIFDFHKLLYEGDISQYIFVGIGVERIFRDGKNHFGIGKHPTSAAQSRPLPADFTAGATLAIGFQTHFFSISRFFQFFQFLDFFNFFQFLDFFNFLVKSNLVLILYNTPLWERGQPKCGNSLCQRLKDRIKIVRKTRKIQSFQSFDLHIRFEDDYCIRCSGFDQIISITI